MENSGQQRQPKIEVLLEECIRRKASDIHVQYGLPPILRIDGTLVPINGMPALNEEMLKDIIFATLDAEQQKIFLKDKEFDYSFAFGDIARFRVNAFHERGKMAAAFRLIPNQIKSINDLGMPIIVESFANYPRGLVLVTGPTGSGKSTTLAALIDKSIAKNLNILLLLKTQLSLRTSQNAPLLFNAKFIMTLLALPPPYAPPCVKIQMLF